MKSAIVFLIWLACTFGANIPPTPCPLESNCAVADESMAICGLDEEVGCIRKYASKCHLDIAACQEKGRNFTDFSEVYCSMEPYLCEKSPTYERWTILFGHEDE
ncbi:uncharacterized protein LOC108028538 isoform X2 [Drosophila biarmipes]|uniref:uncharacterized protein LOC108028538 isoform X2 n=1 Tax=Drosophila biarmipes TaxID=125945 RepID=UPI0007E7793E|nr:uncharacterized protein LOC108028538 isoform X2 [Drosophila biarmipes]